MTKFNDADIQALMGRVLRLGVIIAMAVVFFGGTLYINNHGHSIANYSVFKGIPPFVQHAGSLINGAFKLQGQSVIQLGIIFLIATPILRVISSVIGFLLEKDYLYTCISLLVLMIIFLSMISGYTS